MKIKFLPILLLLALLLTVLFAPPVLASEKAGDQGVISAIESISTEREISPAAITIATDYQALKQAIENGADNIMIMNDIYMEDSIVIDHDIFFAAYPEATIYSCDTERHFIISRSATSSCKLEFSNIILDGNKNAGGIFSWARLTLKNAIIQNCVGKNDTDRSPYSIQGGAVHGYGDLEIFGCRIVNNYADGSGGGIHGDDSILIDQESEISNNEASGGGGVCISAKTNNQLMITGNSKIKNNSATSGGGIEVSPSKYGVIDISGGVEISGNRATYGGGCFILPSSNASIYIRGAIIKENYADSWGGGIYLSGNTVNITDSTLLNNSSGNIGGAVYSTTAAKTDLTGCNILFNNAKSAGGGVYVENGCTLNVFGCILQTNEALNGGAIYSRKSNLENISVDEDTIFDSNKASKGYIIESDDIVLHREKIKTKHFTAPFEYAYNNYDISYNEGIVVETVRINFYTTKNQTEAFYTADVLTGFSFPENKMPEPPSREGAIFANWGDESGQPFNPKDIITENINLYALWFLED